MPSPIFQAMQGVELPDVLALQFYHDCESGYDVFLDGILERVWYRPKWLIAFLIPLEKLGVLISEKGNSIPTTLTVRAEIDENGECFHVWRRRFYGRKTRKFDVKVIFDRQNRHAIDLVGKGAFLALAWEIGFEDAKLNINVQQAGVRVNQKIYWLPNWLWPLLLGRETFQQIAIDNENVSIELTIRHPMLGNIFGYQGRFKVMKINRQESADA